MADATPSVGVTNVGEVLNTKLPAVPVSSVIALATLALVLLVNCARVPSVYATVPPPPKATVDAFVPFNVTDSTVVVILFPLATCSEPPLVVVMASPFTLVAVATPRVGVTNKGELNVLLVSVCATLMVANVEVLAGSVNTELLATLSVVRPLAFTLVVLDGNANWFDVDVVAL